MLNFRIAAAIVLLAVCPSVVRASCGDWLESSHSPMRTETETVSEEEASGSSPSPAPAPCRGLACESSQNGPIPLPPSERRPQLSDDLVLRATRERMADPAVDFVPREQTPRQRRGWPLQVDRPPEL